MKITAYNLHKASFAPAPRFRSPNPKSSAGCHRSLRDYPIKQSEESALSQIYPTSKSRPNGTLRQDIYFFSRNGASQFTMDRITTSSRWLNTVVCERITP